jgi:hypothetical protein
MNLLKLSPCLLLLLLIGHASASAQADSLLPDKATATVRRQYLQNLGAGSSFYTGKVYERYWTGIKGHPFFLGEQYNQGSVNYQGVDYENISLLYDMSRDVLVTRDFTGELAMELLGEKVSRFRIANHRFMNINPDSTSAMRPGFYEILYDGSVTVLVKRVNQVVRITRRDDEPGKVSADRQFTEYDEFYVLKDSRYNNIRGESDLSGLFKDRRAELRKFLNRSKPSYRKDPAAAIVAAVSYYEQLKK